MNANNGRQHPSIVQREKRRYSGTERRQHTQIEVAAVEVVQVD